MHLRLHQMMLPGVREMTCANQKWSMKPQLRPTSTASGAGHTSTTECCHGMKERMCRSCPSVPPPSRSATSTVCTLTQQGSTKQNLIQMLVCIGTMETCGAGAKLILMALGDLLPSMAIYCDGRREKMCRSCSSVPPPFKCVTLTMHTLLQNVSTRQNFERMVNSIGMMATFGHARLQSLSVSCLLGWPESNNPSALVRSTPWMRRMSRR
mmetsp:Transcript_19185/g.35169  ORF Transcript_19185/g.35169 Transcript_19185/m.35169 type:complete len:210 (+) Transcript_19185:463-1092(+)